MITITQVSPTNFNQLPLGQVNTTLAAYVKKYHLWYFWGEFWLLDLGEGYNEIYMIKAVN